jgi:hypothetical protein
MISSILLAITASLAQAPAANQPPWADRYIAGKNTIQQCQRDANDANCQPAINHLKVIVELARASGDIQGEHLLLSEFALLTTKWSEGEMSRRQPQRAADVAGQAFQYVQDAMKRPHNSGLLIRTGKLVIQLSLALRETGDAPKADEILAYLRRFGERVWSSKAMATTPSQKRILCDAVLRYAGYEKDLAEKGKKSADDATDRRLSAEAYREAAKWAERAASDCSPNTEGKQMAQLDQALNLLQYAYGMDKSGALAWDAPELRDVYAQVEKLSCHGEKLRLAGTWSKVCFQAQLMLGFINTPMSDKSWLTPEEIDALVKSAAELRQWQDQESERE